MEFIELYGRHLGELIAWLSKPETSIPAIKLIQAIAALMGATISVLGFYKAWRYAEKRLGDRLNEFLENEEQKLADARKLLRSIHDQQHAVARSLPTIFSSNELQIALKMIGKKRTHQARNVLQGALARSQERANLAAAKCELHRKQVSMVHHLLGAIADGEGEPQDALIHFQKALEADPNDVEALEYIGLQFLKLGNPTQALIEFGKLEQIARVTDEPLLLAQALRNSGMAYEAPPIFSYSGAVSSYRWAVEAFPKDGPPLELARLHELRGFANIKANNSNRATRSLLSALAGYEALLKRNGDVGKAARDGRDRVSQALRRLQQMQNGSIHAHLEADLSERERPPPLPSSQQQAAQEPPNGERAN